MNCIFRVALPLAMMLSLVSASSVYGQDQLGTGRGLDAPLQVNGPGNTVRDFPDVAARNNLITGNVSGLSYFRGTVPYRNPNELYVSAGSDTLHRFRARSVPSSFTAGTQPRSGFSRTYTTQPAQQTFTESITHTKVIPASTETYRFYDSYYDLRVASTIPSVRLGQRIRSDGSIIETTASPLLGLREHTYDPTSGLGLLKPLPSTESPSPSPEASVDAGLRRKVPDDTGTSAGQPQIDSTWKPSLELGRQLDTQLFSDPGTPSLEKRIEQIQAGLLQRLKASRTAGPDVYSDLMAQIERYWKISDAERAKAFVSPPNPEEHSNLPQTSAAVSAVEGEGGSEAFPMGLDMPTLDQLQDAASRREQAWRQVLGIPAEIESLDLNRTLAEQIQQHRQGVIHGNNELQKTPPAVAKEEPFNLSQDLAAQIQQHRQRLIHGSVEQPQGPPGAAKEGPFDLSQDLAAQIRQHRQRLVQGGVEQLNGPPGVAEEGRFRLHRNQAEQIQQRRRRVIHGGIEQPATTPTVVKEEYVGLNRTLADRMQQHRRRVIHGGIEQPSLATDVANEEHLDVNSRFQEALVGRAVLDPVADPHTQAVLEKMLRALEFRSPSLKTLAGTQRNRMNRLLEEAEDHIAEGRYFEAEDTYRMVLQGVPDHPMARIGMIHAQIGAGLYRSAGLNLRSLFEQHPELIAARYEARLLPRISRLREAGIETEKIIQLADRSEPALLLAYLGYQVGPRELVVYGLDRAAASNPIDPLVALLRRLWMVETHPAAPPDGSEGAGATAIGFDAKRRGDGGAVPKSSK